MLATGPKAVNNRAVRPEQRRQERPSKGSVRVTRHVSPLASYP